MIAVTQQQDPARTRSPATLQARAEHAWRLQLEDPETSAALAREVLSEDASSRAARYAQLALAYYECRYGDAAAAEVQFQALAQGFAADGDRRGAMLVINGLSFVESRRDHGELSYTMVQQAWEAHADALHEFDVMLIQNGLGAGASDLGRLEESLAAYYHALDAARTLGMPSAVAVVSSNLASSQFTCGNLTDAHELLLDADRLCREHGMRSWHPLVAGNLANCQIIMGDAAAARATVSAWVDGHNVDNSHAQHSHLAHLNAVAAHACILTGDLEAAQRLQSRAMAEARLGQDTRIGVHCDWVKALLQRAQGDAAGALQTLLAADARLQGVDDPYYPIEISGELASLYAQLGQWQSAYEWQRRHHELRVDILAKGSRARYSSLRIQQELREQAIRDPLTGLYNRRHLAEQLQREMAISRRSGRPLSVAVVDLDHFKRVNDEHGHAAGDAALVGTARFLLSRLRSTDIVCRYGGEEFVLVLPETPREAAIALLQALLSEFHTQSFRWPGGVLSGLSFSAGVACALVTEDADALIAQADERLYAAKHAGRAQVLG